MTFEERRKAYECTPFGVAPEAFEVYADWKAERDQIHQDILRHKEQYSELSKENVKLLNERKKLLKVLETTEVALEEYRIKRRHHFEEREKLIGVLGNVLRNAECETSKHYAVENCAEKGVKNPCEVCRARAVLAGIISIGG